MRPIAVELLTPHRLRRWVLPLGFAGLGAIFAVTMTLHLGGLAFEVARFVFTGAYLVLVGVGLSRKRRATTITVDAEGLHEAGTLLVPRAAIRQVLSSRTATLATIELRGPALIALETRSATDADALLAALDPDRATAPMSFLATTTPTYLVVLAWIGIPLLLSAPLQLVLQRGTDPAGLVALGVPAAVLWLGASWWFMRRRRITITGGEIALPSQFSSTDQLISLGELTGVAVLATFTVELQFSSRRPRRFKIYDPALVSDVVARLQKAIS